MPRACLLYTSKRLIQTEVETLLARWIIAEDPAPETAITVDYDGEKLVAM